MTPGELSAIRERDAMMPDGLRHGPIRGRLAWDDRRALLAEVDRLRAALAGARALAAPRWEHVKPGPDHEATPHHTGQGNSWFVCGTDVPDERGKPVRCDLPVRCVAVVGEAGR